MAFAFSDIAERDIFGAALPRFHDEKEKWAIFIVASYILGHFVSYAGSRLDDYCDDIFIRGKLSKNKELYNKAWGIAQRLPLEEDDLIETKNPTGIWEPIRAGLREGVYEIVKYFSGIPSETETKTYAISRWANTFIRLTCPEAAVQLDQLEAESKFFRSLTIVFLFLSIRFSLKCQWAAIGAALIFSILSLMRYAHIRWRRTRMAYEFFIALDVLKKLNLDANDKTIKGFE